MDNKLRLLNITEIFEKLGRKYELDMLWSDFLMWAAIQAGTPYDKVQADFITSKYSDDDVWQFGRAYSMVEVEIKRDPHQNVLLKAMCELDLSNQYFYDELLVKEKLIQKLSETRQQNLFKMAEFERLEALFDVDAFSIKDNNCSETYGSTLIATANVVKELFPIDYEERVMLEAIDHKDKTGSLIAFIQFSLMGMAGYACLGNVFYPESICSMDLFAPPGSVCSSKFYLESWDDARMMAINRGIIYGTLGDLT